jgi:hypothetical protein
MPVRLKSVSNYGNFTLQAERGLHPYLPSHCNGVTEICHIGVPAHALRAVQVRLKSVRNKGQFALEAENFFGLISTRIAVGWLKYATWHSLRMCYELCNFRWNRSVMKGALLLRPKVCRPYLPSQCSGVREIRHTALPAHALQAVQVGLKSVGNEGHFILKAETVRPISPLIAVGWLKYPTWRSLRLCYVPCKLGWNRSVMKGTLFFMSKQFFTRIYRRIAVGKQLFAVSPYALQWGDWNTPSGTPCACATSSASWVEVGQ